VGSVPVDSYQELVEGKIALAEKHGFVVDPDRVNPLLYGHQRDLVVWGIRGGRRALFAAFGLGKTMMQLEICRIILEEKGGKALVICPLGVKQEFHEDARKLGGSIEYVRNDAEVAACSSPLMITNYERVRDGAITVDGFTVVSLDEASVLRGYGTKTFQEFLRMFPAVPYRFVCTATPAPNRFKELIHYAGFLGIMDTGQALTRFFQRDSSKAGNLTLYPHKEREFWLWMASWACFLTKPSDLGYSDEGYDLPEMHVHWHKVEVDHTTAGVDRDGQAKLFRDAALSLQDTAREKRESLPARVSKMVEIVGNDPDRHFLLWHDLEDERRAIKKALPDCKEVYGSLDIEKREERIIDFAYGRYKYLATKPRISGSGCNFQRHCSDAVFVGITYKFNDFIQAVHRIYRFLQEREVHIHVIYAESEQDVVRVLKEKWRRHEEMVKQMTDIVKEYGLSKQAMADNLKRTIGVERQQVTGQAFTAVHNDCVIECRDMESASVDLVCTSIPFGNHYEYSANYNDFGHNEDNDRFFDQMDHLTPELLRILKPGRVAAIHVKDRILFGNVTGYGMPSVDPFHALTLFHFMKHGFIFIGMITIETDVVRENNQTYRLGWSEQCKDGSKMGVGCPEYLLIFRRRPTDASKAYADEKVTKSKDEYTRARWQIDARAKWNSSGERFMTPEELASMPIDQITARWRDEMRQRVYDYRQHVADAEQMDSAGKLPATFETLRVPARDDGRVWGDVNRMLTLNSEQTRKKLQNHICPLQFDIVDRCINRWSSAGELVFDPFGGIMTVPYRAIKMGRRGYGCELNAEYFKDGVAYCQAAEREVLSPTLFDLCGVTAGEIVETDEMAVAAGA